MVKKMISIEGNIGVGKSTLISKLIEYIESSDVINEPIDKWLNITDSHKSNILKVFYENKKRWSYTFQSLTYVTRMDEYRRKNKIIG